MLLVVYIEDAIVILAHFVLVNCNDILPPF